MDVLVDLGHCPSLVFCCFSFFVHMGLTHTVYMYVSMYFFFFDTERGCMGGAEREREEDRILRRLHTQHGACFRVRSHDAGIIT